MKMEKPKACAREKHGIAFSVEAMLAAMVLFVMILFSASLSSSISKPFRGVDQVAYVADGIADAGAKGGAWLYAGQPSPDDSQARALVQMAPPSVCVKAEIFNGTVSQATLLWAYSSCNATEGFPKSVSQRPFVRRANSTGMEFRVARVSAWPRAG